MKNIFQKSAMALAVASLSVGAFAGALDTATTPITLANEIFGAGSQETLIATPDVEFAVTNATASLVAAQRATFKFTLDKGAVFGEDLSDIQKWFDSSANLTFGGAALQQDTTPVPGVVYVGAPGDGNLIVVDQGGAIGDNTVTFLITAGATPVDLSGVVTAGAISTASAEIGNFRVKNLTSALERGVTNPAVRLGAEFRNLDVTTNNTDTAPATVIFTSQNGVGLTASVITNYEGTPGLRARIDVADVEESFTGNALGNTGTGAAQDFNELDNVDFVDLGSLAVTRSTTGTAPNVEFVKKENGDDFDFNGSDNIAITITSTQSLAAYDSIYLRPGTAASCDATVVAADFDATPGNGNSVTIDLDGETTVDLEAGYRVCALASGDQVIPESSFSATLNVGYFNPRYTESVDTVEYGQILRNGCSVTLFNLPTTSVGDDAYIRLTNVSEKPGAVRASVWTEDGEQIDIGAQLVDTLEAHATVVLHTNEGQGNGVFLGDVLEDYSALTSGRHRIQLQGAFPACEAMGLIRTPAGVLVNMTSTTYSGDASRLGSFNNGTSNTSN